MDKGYSESSPPFCYFRLSSSDYIVYKYDAKTSADRPPNTLPFDPKTRARSLFEDPKKLTGTTDMLQVFQPSSLMPVRSMFLPVLPLLQKWQSYPPPLHCPQPSHPLLQKTPQPSSLAFSDMLRSMKESRMRRCLKMCSRNGDMALT